MKPQTKTSGTPDDDISKLKAELRRELLPVIKRSLVSEKILQFLHDQAKKRQSAGELARTLTRFLAQTWSFAPLKDSPVQRLIENRPRELHAVVYASRWDDFQQFAKAIASLPPKKRARTKPQTDDERRRNTRMAKARHERRRRRRRQWEGGGLIVREFTDLTPSANPNESIASKLGLYEILTGRLPGVLPGGPCLDGIFRGGDVQMSEDIYCLEDLFGRSRKMLPTSLRRRREGREFFYGSTAVLQCIDALLNERNRRRPWLPDAAVRQFVLAGILRRAQANATPEILADFEATLRKHIN